MILFVFEVEKFWPRIILLFILFLSILYNTYYMLNKRILS